jgi:hypothetical protein
MESEHDVREVGFLFPRQTFLFKGHNLSQIQALTWTSFVTSMGTKGDHGTFHILLYIVYDKENER